MFQINAFGEKTFSNDFVYLAIYSLHPETEVSLAFSFKTDYCKATLSGEEAFNDLAIAKHAVDDDDHVNHKTHKVGE